MTQKTVCFAQVRTKQVRIEVQLYQDEALIPVVGSTIAKTEDVAGAQIQTEAQKTEEQTRDQKEFQEKLKQLEGMTEAQKVIFLKKAVNEQKLRNRKMITKQLRLKKETENMLRLMEEAKSVKPAPTVQKQEAEPDLVAEFKALVSRSSFQTSAAQKKTKVAMSGALGAKN